MKVKDLFDLSKDFKNIKLISGEEGISNKIDNIEILEVPDGVYWVKENDLIITTGYFFKDNKDSFRNFIETLIYRKAAAVGIKLGRFINEIPEEIVNLSEDKKFPIIKIPPHIRYSNILWPVMTNLINKNHYEKYLIDKYKGELTFLIKNDYNIESLIELMCNYIGNECIIVSESRDKIIRNNSNIKFEKIKELIEKNHENILEKDSYTKIIDNDYCFYVSKIRSVNETIAYICIKTKATKELNATEFRIIEETIPFISIFLLSNKDDILIYNKNIEIFLKKLINNNYNNKELKLKEDAVSLGIDYDDNKFIWILEFDEEDNEKIDYLYFAKLIKEYMKSYNKDYYLIKDRRNIIVIASLEKNQIDLKIFNGLFIDLINQMKVQYKNKSFRIGISKTCSSLKYLNYAYEESLFALKFGEKINDKIIHYYDDYMIYHLLHEVSDHPSLTKIYRNTLQKIKKYDNKTGSKLMDTIETLIDCDFSISKSSNELFIHRNTLYKRIEKINEILEFDIDKSEGRLILQIAVKLNKIID